MKKDRMNEYTAIFKMKIIEGFQYRAAALAGIATQFFFGFMYVMIYRAFYEGGATAQPMSITELTSYLWLRQAFLLMYVMWRQDMNLLDSITNGQVAYEFCRPYSLYEFWFARFLAERISKVLLRCFPILIVTSFLPYGWRLNPPGEPLSLLLFAISLCTGMLLATAVTMFIYIITFFTLSPYGTFKMFQVTSELLSGAVIPIILMPDWIQRILYSLPFAYMADVPFRIYSGNIPPTEAVRGIGIQLLWVVILLITGKLCFTKIQSRVVIQGG